MTVVALSHFQCKSQLNDAAVVVDDDCNYTYYDGKSGHVIDDVVSNAANMSMFFLCFHIHGWHVRDREASLFITSLIFLT